MWPARLAEQRATQQANLLVLKAREGTARSTSGDFQVKRDAYVVGIDASPAATNTTNGSMSRDMTTA